MQIPEYDRPSGTVQNYLDFIDSNDPEVVLREYDNLSMHRRDSDRHLLLHGAYEEAVILYPIDSKDEPDSAPRLLNYFAQEGSGQAVNLTLMALSNLAAVNSKAASYAYTQCMNRGYMNADVEEVLGLGADLGIQPLRTTGNLAYLGVARRLRA